MKIKYINQEVSDKYKFAEIEDPSLPPIQFRGTIRYRLLGIFERDYSNRKLHNRIWFASRMIKNIVSWMLFKSSAEKISENWKAFWTGKKQIVIYKYSPLNPEIPGTQQPIISLKNLTGSDTSSIENSTPLLKTKEKKNDSFAISQAAFEKSYEQSIQLLIDLEKAMAKNNRQEQEKIQRRKKELNQEMNQWYEDEVLQQHILQVFKSQNKQLTQDEFNMFCTTQIQNAFIQRSIEECLQLIKTEYSILENGAVQITDSPSAKTAIQRAKIAYTSDGSVITILPQENYSNLAKLKKYLQEEIKLVNAIQNRFDALFKDEEEGDWNVRLRVDGIGAYHIEIPSEGQRLKKIFSVYQILKKIQAKNYQSQSSASSYPTLDNNYLLQLPTHFSLSGKETLDSIFTLFRLTELAQEQLRQLFGDLDETITINIGKKPLNDLYQRSNAQPAEYESRFGISYDLAQKLQQEKGVIFLPNALQLSTTRKEIRSFLEACYKECDMKAFIGQPKTFLLESGLNGQPHLSNLDWDQLESVKAILQKCLSSIPSEQKHTFFEKSLQDLRRLYKIKLRTEITDFAIDILHIRTPLPDPLRLKLEGLTKTENFKEIDSMTTDIYQFLLDTYTVPGQQVWKEPNTISLEKVQIALGTTRLQGQTPIRLQDQALLKKIAENFQQTSFYQENRTNAAFTTSWKKLYNVFEKRIRDARDTHFANSPFYNDLILKEAFNFFERFIYNLKFETITPSIKENLLNCFIARTDDWSGCTEGLAGKLQDMLVWSMGNDGSQDAALLKLKMRLIEKYWELRLAIGISGYEHETVTLKTVVNKALSEKLGLGIEYTNGSAGSLIQKYNLYVKEAEAFVQIQLDPCQGIFIPFLRSFSEQLAILQRDKESPESFLKSLGLSDKDITSYQDMISLEWDYLRIEQSLSKMLIQFLIDKKYLNPVKRATYSDRQTYQNFLNNLASSKPQLYESNGFGVAPVRPQPVVAPPQPSYVAPVRPPQPAVAPPQSRYVAPIMSNIVSGTATLYRVVNSNLQ